jgi:hypothetical protein
MKTLTWSWGPSFGQNHEFHLFKSCTHLDQALIPQIVLVTITKTIRGQDALSTSPFLVIDDNYKITLLLNV